MKDLLNINHIYFLGIGGIGMSALARYFHRRGTVVSGYDRARTPLTLALQAEGMLIHYEDEPALIPGDIGLVIYTPAIPGSLAEWRYCQELGVPLLKRARVLGLIAARYQLLAVAGSHGKTSTANILAHLLHHSGNPCLAFLGGISANFNSNLLDDPGARCMLAEADEYDRSFLALEPDLAIITATDPDHLDIYGDHAAMKQAFATFISQIKPGGKLLLNEKVKLEHVLPPTVQSYTYGLSPQADFYPARVLSGKGNFQFDLVTPNGTIPGYHLTMPGLLSLENATAALAAASLLALPAEATRQALASSKGVARRMEKIHEDGKTLYIDDYAHHPEEIKACIQSVRQSYPGRHITGIFQPHLFSRTRDLADDFARSLEELDSLLLMEIYPAREEPIPGINAAFLLEKINLPGKVICDFEQVLDQVKARPIDILLTLGAGDIDRLAAPLRQYLANPNPSGNGTI